MSATVAPLGIQARYAAPAADVDRDPQKGWFRRLSPLLLAQRRLIGFLLGVMFVGAGVSIAIPWIVGKALDDALVNPIRELAPMIWAMAGLAVVAGLLGMVNTYAMRKAVQSMEYDLRGLIYEHLTRLSFSFYDRVQTGQPALAHCLDGR